VRHRLPALRVADSTPRSLRGCLLRDRFGGWARPSGPASVRPAAFLVVGSVLGEGPVATEPPNMRVELAGAQDAPRRWRVAAALHAVTATAPLNCGQRLQLTRGR